jgi:hypothetical protein
MLFGVFYCKGITIADCRVILGVIEVFACELSRRLVEEEEYLML